VRSVVFVRRLHSRELIDAASTELQVLNIHLHGLGPLEELAPAAMTVSIALGR